MITLPGFSLSTKTPGFYAYTQFGAGPINLFTIPLVMLIVALKASASGTITPDVDTVDILTKEDADTYGGTGGEAACMAYDAIDEGEGFQLKMFCPAAAGGAAAATVTITFVGNATGDGQWIVYVDGIAFPVLITNGMTPTQQATAVRDALLQNARLSMLASNAAGVLTLTDKSLTVRGNQAVVFIDKSGAPAGTTATLAGGSAVTSSTLVQGVFASGGSGTETLTTTLAALFPGRYNRVAIAQNDATSLGLWVTQTNSKASATQGRTEHLVFATNGTLSAAISLSQTTVNNQRFQHVWMKNSETRPSRIAASMCAIRASVENTQPNSSYDDQEFVTVTGQRFQSDWCDFATSESALNAGVTPLRSTSAGKAQVIRSITCRSLDGTTPDYRTIDTGQAAGSDFVRDYVKVAWTTDFKRNMKWVKPDPKPGEKKPGSGIATPTIWNNYLSAKLRSLGDGEGGAKILTQTDLPEHQPQSEFNSVLGGIMTALEFAILPANHSQGVLFRQGQVIV